VGGCGTGGVGTGLAMVLDQRKPIAANVASLLTAFLAAGGSTLRPDQQLEWSRELAYALLHLVGHRGLRVLLKSNH